MRVDLSSDEINRNLAEEIAELCGQDVLKCYQCGRCSAGCPMAEEMDLLPNQVARLIQMGLEQEVLDSKTVWLCVSCFMCQSRCPKGVDLPTLMESLRFLATKRGFDHFGPDRIDREVIARAPQQGIVGAYRKQSS
jgi:heterodisulfide reductase subunit C